jgi:hypothetical protein
LRALDLIGVLAAHHVDYVVIGGFAAIAHGSPRATRDLDIVAAPDNDNLARLLAALGDLEADRLLPGRPPRPVTAADVATIGLGTTLHARTRAGELDVVGRPAGAPAYEQLRVHAVAVPVGGHEVRVAGLDHLIAMKRAAGRPLDLQDIADLTEP